jgi:hypothetical protein
MVKASAARRLAKLGHIPDVTILAGHQTKTMSHINQQ